jgi:hypothetical protein
MGHELKDEDKPVDPSFQEDFSIDSNF